jgi:replicative DNA helicase
MSEITESTGLNKVNFGTYGKHFQECVMAGLLSDNRWAEQMMEVFDTEYFELKYLRFLAEKYFAYSRKYKVFPTLQLLVTIIKEDLKTGSDALLRDQIIDYLTRIRANPMTNDMQYAKEKSLDFCKKQALKHALETAVDQMQAEKYESIVETIRRAVSVGTVPAVGHDFLNDMEARFTRQKRDTIPTGLAELDKKEIFNGGSGKGELYCVIGATGAGKCSVRDTYIHVRYTTIKINGKSYKPWDKIRTKRGEIFARDIVKSDELL